MTLNASADQRFRAAARKTAVHELGHVLNIGENEPDERINGSEVYSGSGADPTLENVIDMSINSEVLEWSVMAGGTERSQYLPPANSTYFVFSIEELFTISTEDTQVENSP